MSIRGWITDKLFGSTIEQKVEEKLKASAVAAGSEEKGWRRLTETPERKLNEVDQDRMIEVSYWLWKNNPLAKWIIEITTAFVTGEGFKIEATEDSVKDTLMAFWNDPVNNMDLYAEKLTREIGIYGELCFPKYTSKHAGMVRLGYVDPAQIKEVKTDPENVKMIIGVILKGRSILDGRKLKTVLPPEAEEMLSPRAQQMRDEYSDGECYFFSINNVTNEPRGTSDLWTVADFLDAYEQFLFDYAEKWTLLNVFVWDMMVKNATADDLDNWIKKFTKKSGSVFAHNENVELKASTPDLKSLEAEAGARLIRNHILGSVGLPEHWFGGGGDVNRATSVEMGTPTFKMLSKRQLLVIHILSYICRDVLITARGKKSLDATDEKSSFKIITPELASRDITKFSSAIQQLTASLAQATLNEWIDEQSAVKIFAFALSFIGYELDVEAIQKAVEDEKEKKPYKDYLVDGKKNGKEPEHGTDN